MRERQFDYIRGNTVVAPERKPRINRDYKKKNNIIRQKNKEKAIIRSKRNDRKYMFVIVSVIFTLGCVTIAGDTKVYNMQRKVTELSSNINTMKEENEALKVKILEYSSLNNIEGSAGAKLGMYIPSSGDVVKIDFSENYFKDVVEEEKTSKNDRSGLFSKIADILSK